MSTTPGPHRETLENNVRVVAATCGGVIRRLTTKDRKGHERNPYRG